MWLGKLLQCISCDGSSFPQDISVSLSLPCAPEVYLRCWNLLEDYPSQANAYLTDIRQVQGGEPSQTTTLDSFLTRSFTLGTLQSFAPPRMHSH